jgi:hypothetical protein
MEIIWLLLADIVLLAAALALFHPSLGQVLLVLGINHTLLFGVGYGLTLGGMRVRNLEA